MAQKDNDSYPDRIAEFYKDRTIFISGASGFVGKTLIEKLLRSCPEIKKIYVLLRKKKGKSPKARLNEIFANPLFDVLKRQNEHVLNKCEAISGDVTDLNLGISEDNRQKLIEEVELIFHSAASTRFDDTLKTATIINARGTKFMLDLAKLCKKLVTFAHISTAYAYPKEEILYEKAYNPPVDPHKVLNAIEWIQEDEKGIVTKTLLGEIPNTYTFSKSIAEALVVEQMDKLPVIILRPSVVIPTWREPIPGWCNNLQGPMGLFVGAGKGIIRSMYVNSESHADFIPVDIAVNAILIAPWDFITYKKSRIFHLTSSSNFQVTWEEIIEIGKYIVTNITPFNGVVWYPGGSMKSSKFIHNICFVLFQLVPAVFIDILLYLLGYKPILVQIQRRIQSGGEVFEYYTTRNWNFAHENSKTARSHLNPREKELYKIDGEGMDLKKYFSDCILSVRRYNLKETDDMLPAARRHLKIMWAVDRLFKGAFLIFVFYYIYKIFVNCLIKV